MSLRCAVLATLLLATAAPARAESAGPGTARGTRATPPSEDRGTLARIRELLPKGWVVRTENLPPGVIGVAFGPARTGLRPVVIVSELPDGLGADVLADARARAFVRNRLGTGTATVTDRGSSGGPELAMTRGDLALRHLVRPGKPGYLVTIAAPPGQLDALYARVLKAAAALE